MAWQQHQVLPGMQLEYSCQVLDTSVYGMPGGLATAA